MPSLNREVSVFELPYNTTYLQDLSNDYESRAPDESNDKMITAISIYSAICAVDANVSIPDSPATDASLDVSVPLDVLPEALESSFMRLFQQHLHPLLMLLSQNLPSLKVDPTVVGATLLTAIDTATARRKPMLKSPGGTAVYATRTYTARHQSNNMVTPFSLKCNNTSIQKAQWINCYQNQEQDHHSSSIPYFHI